MPDSVTPWTIASQAPLSVGFPRQEYWSGLPFPSSGDLPDPEIKTVSLALAGGSFTPEPPEPNSHLFTPIVQSLLYFKRRKWKPTPVFLPGKSHGQMSMVGSSPWDCKELDVT